MNKIDFPLLRTFEVDELIVDFLNRKFDQYRSNNPKMEEYTAFYNEKIDSGYQTGNMLDWNDSEYKEFTDGKLLDLISKQLFISRDKISFYWTHMLEYINGGEMGYHKHNHNEDYVLFIYLSTCESGNTVFHLNDFNEEYFKRTTISLKPIKNTAALFSSMLLHKGEFTLENKKIFVVGIRIDTRN